MALIVGWTALAVAAAKGRPPERRALQNGYRADGYRTPACADPECGLHWSRRVLGLCDRGGVVLKVWADERKAARMLPAADVASSAMAEPSSLGEDAHTDEGTAQSSVAKVGERDARAPLYKVKAAKAAKALGSPTTAPEPVSGGPSRRRRQRPRVRLIGSNGTFGSGLCPRVATPFRPPSGAGTRAGGTVQARMGTSSSSARRRGSAVSNASLDGCCSAES